MEMKSEQFALSTSDGSRTCCANGLSKVSTCSRSSVFCLCFLKRKFCFHTPVFRSMFDSDLAEGAGATQEFKAINRHVETATPALTRLSFFGSTCEYQYI